MRTRRNILPFILTIALLVLLYFIVDKDKWLVFTNIDFIDIFTLLFIAVIIQLFSGIQYYLIRKQFGVSLKLKDIFLLPSVMGLWSFLMPVQGNLIFTTYFFKRKYNMKISESLSINIYLYLVTLSFTGIFILFFTISNHQFLSWLSLIACILSLNPLLIVILNIAFNKIGDSKFRIIRKVQDFLSSVINNTKDLWMNFKFTLLILLINIIKLILSIVWFYFISKVLGFDLSLLDVALISLLMSASLIIKITPGNLGTVQFITGGFMGLIGFSPDQAILITLLASTIVLILNFTVGIYGNYYYFKTMNIFSLKE